MSSDEITAFRSHWWWRPGWRVGTRYYSWHLLFAEQPAMRELVGAYQAALSGFAVLDPVPPRWLHLTTQGIGHVGEVTADQRDAMVDAVSGRLGAVARPTSSFCRPDVTHEGVELTPADREPLRAVQRAIQAGMAEAMGAQAVPGLGETFYPHLSLAYANGVAPRAPVREALASLDPDPASVTWTHASLIEMHRDNRLYEWEVVDTAAIAG